MNDADFACDNIRGFLDGLETTGAISRQSGTIGWQR